MIEIITVNPTFINKSLQSATNRIMTIGKTVRKCAFETAYIMAKVDESECYKDDGFNSVHEWAMSTFGFKKSASYTLLRVGKEYTRAIMGDNGKVKSYSSNLVEPESEIDFTTSQIEKMLPAGRESVVELVGEGEITPAMSCKEIAKVIKDYTNEESESNETEVHDEPIETESNEVSTIENPVSLRQVFAALSAYGFGDNEKNLVINALRKASPDDITIINDIEL